MPKTDYDKVATRIFNILRGVASPLWIKKEMERINKEASKGKRKSNKRGSIIKK
tara:strand:- start:362 stop:523 length:162 start_codon:yes stop_codon:yes gene_type:complete